MTADDPLDVRAVLAAAHRAAVEAGFEDPIWGTAVVLAEVVARLARKMPEFRRATE